jgi:hypothetical protein
MHGEITDRSLMIAHQSLSSMHPLSPGEHVSKLTPGHIRAQCPLLHKILRATPQVPRVKGPAHSRQVGPMQAFQQQPLKGTDPTSAYVSRQDEHTGTLQSKGNSGVTHIFGYVSAEIRRPAVSVPPKLPRKRLLRNFIGSSPDFVNRSAISLAYGMLPVGSSMHADPHLPESDHVRSGSTRSPLTSDSVLYRIPVRTGTSTQTISTLPAVPYAEVLALNADSGQFQPSPSESLPPIDLAVTIPVDPTRAARSDTQGQAIERKSSTLFIQDSATLRRQPLHCAVRGSPLRTLDGETGAGPYENVSEVFDPAALTTNLGKPLENRATIPQSRIAYRSMVRLTVAPRHAGVFSIGRCLVRPGQLLWERMALRDTPGPVLH